MDWQAFWLTTRLAVLVAATLVVVGLPIAYWIAYSRWRWKFLVEAVVALPIVLPPTVLGLYVLIAIGSRSPLGRWWQSLTGHTLAFTFEGLGDWFDFVQPAFCGAAFCGSICQCRFTIDRGFFDVGCFETQNIFSRDSAALCSGVGDWSGVELCAHYGRVWSRADGGRKYSRRYAHGFHCDL